MNTYYDIDGYRTGRYHMINDLSMRYVNKEILSAWQHTSLPFSVPTCHPYNSIRLVLAVGEKLVAIYRNCQKIGHVYGNQVSIGRLNHLVILFNRLSKPVACWSSHGCGISLSTAELNAIPSMVRMHNSCTASDGFKVQNSRRKWAPTSAPNPPC